MAYADGTRASRLVVRQWSGAAWGFLRLPPSSAVLAAGQEDTEGASIGEMAMATSGGTLWVAHMSFLESNKVKVLQWDGNDWQLLGGAAISSTKATSLAMVADPSTPRPIVAFVVRGSASQPASQLADTHACTRGEGAGDPSPPPCSRAGLSRTQRNHGQALAPHNVVLGDSGRRGRGAWEPGIYFQQPHVAGCLDRFWSGAGGGIPGTWGTWGGRDARMPINLALQGHAGCPSLELFACCVQDSNNGNKVAVVRWDAVSSSWQVRPARACCAACLAAPSLRRGARVASWLPHFCTHARTQMLGTTPFNNQNFGIATGNDGAVFAMAQALNSAFVSCLPPRGTLCCATFACPKR